MNPAGTLDEETVVAFTPEERAGMSRLLGLRGVRDRTPSAELVEARGGARPNPDDDGRPIGERSGEKGEVRGGGDQEEINTTQLAPLNPALPALFSPRNR